MAGTVLRRWNGNGGGRRQGPVSQVDGILSSGKVAGPVVGGAETVLIDAQIGVLSGFESDLSGVERDGTQFCGTVAVPVGRLRRASRFAVRGSDVSPAAEDTFGGTQSSGGSRSWLWTCGTSRRLGHAWLSRSWLWTCGTSRRLWHVCWSCCWFWTSGTSRRFWAWLLVVLLAILQLVVLLAWGDVRSVRMCAWSALRRVRLTVLMTRFSSCRSESPSSRVSRVTSALHNLCPVHSSSFPAHNSHARMSDARRVVNSVGDTEDGGRSSCVYGETKSLSTCTRTGVRRPAVEKLASPQQASSKLHVETWAGLLKNQGPKIFRDEEIIPGCAVRVACPSCPDYYPEPPGPSIVIRNMIGWSLKEKTEKSGVWVFRGALQGENLFSLLDAAGDWVQKGSYHTAWAVPGDSSCSCSYAYGHGPAVGPHTGRRCWPLLAGVWRAIAPLMKPWCAEGDVPTAANLNLYRGWKSCVGWHRDDEPLFGKCGDAKLIVSVSLGSFALFRWRRQSCLSNEDSSCRLDHGDILVMDGQCQDEFLHRTSPGREQNRINITFRWVKQHAASCPLFKAGVACCLPTCAQGSSVSVMGNVCPMVFFGFLGFFLASCAYGESSFFWSPCYVQDLGYLGVPHAGHALLVEFGWGFTFVTPGENT